MSSTPYQYISIPQKIERFKYSVDFEKDWYILEILEEENYQIRDIYFEMNDKLNLLIDDYESENLPAEKVKNAIKIVEDFITKQTDEQKISTATKVLNHLQFAEKLGMPVRFDF